MNTRKSVLSIIGVMMFLLAVAVSCHSQKPLDLVRDIEPVSREFVDLGWVNTELAKIKEEERPAWIRSHFPDLSARVLGFVISHNMIKEGVEIEKIEVVFGSAEGVSAKDSKGTSHQGFVKNQLVARIYLDNKEHTTIDIDMLLLCANGMVASAEKWKGFSTVQIFAEPEPPKTVVTIEQGQSLCWYLDVEDALGIAFDHDLAVYKCQTGDPSCRIDVFKAYEMIDERDAANIIVVVFPGDKLDITEEGFPVYFPANLKPGIKGQ